MKDSTEKLSKELLILDPKDNIAVLKRPVQMGCKLFVPAGAFTLSKSLGMGHKLAIRSIGQGQDILKYGAPIGFASQNIAMGDHVHLHNLTSRYTVIEDMEASNND